MSDPLRTATADVGPVREWLGLGLTVPAGLHGRNRGRLVRRHTTSEGGAYLHEALARTYAPNRETVLLHLLRPQQLNDGLWRSVYSILATGGPLNAGSLLRQLALLTGPERAVAQLAAEELWRQWDRLHRRAQAETPVMAE